MTLFITSKASGDNYWELGQLKKLYAEGWRVVPGTVALSAVRAFLFFHSHIAVTLTLERPIIS